MIQLRHVTKTFHTPAGPFHALVDIGLSIPPGQLTAITGKSGSGKSTLLHLIGGIDQPSTGEVFVDGEAIHGRSERDLAVWRGSCVGIVFQFFQLLPTLTALENVTLPMDFARTRRPGQRRAYAMQLLERVGLADQAHRLPGALSGGQQQRVAIARALANNPPVITADEPTGNLDSETADSVLGLLLALSRERRAVIIATHDRDICNLAAQTITLTDGRIDGVRQS